MVLIELDQGIVTACPVCGWTTLEGMDLCVACLDIREWSRVNRAFCEFVHRTPHDRFVPQHATAPHFG